MTDVTDGPPDAVPDRIPPWSLPATNRRVILARRPAGIPRASDFHLDAVPVPAPGAGSFLVRNIFLSVDPAQRGWAADGTNYAAPAMPGQTMRALAVGVVVASRDPAMPEGRYLYGWFGWQDYAVATAADVLCQARHGVALEHMAGLLGINGLTALLAFDRLGRPGPGDTVLVSTAAGTVGSLVGQIGRILGCTTLGLTGSAEKVARCRDRFGYDAAFDYRSDDLDTALRDHAPRGIDVFFDNTGGDILDTALRHMAQGGRIVQCGTAAIPAWIPAPTGLRNEREILTRRLTWSGFVIFDHPQLYEAAADRLAAWHSEGRLVIDYDILSGIEAAPGALTLLYGGHNRGKVLIQLS